MSELTQAKLKYYLTYNKFDGVFYWNDNFNSVARKGKIAGSKCNVCKKDRITTILRADIQLEGKKYLSHRLAWLYEYGEFPNKPIRHKDGDMFNNRIDNLCLEEKSRIIRLHNNKKTKGKLLKGVAKKFNKYQSQLFINGKNIYLGLFYSEIEAHKAYLDAKAKYLQTQKPDGICS